MNEVRTQKYIFVDAQVHVSDLSVDGWCANEMCDDQCTSKMKSEGNKVVLEVGPRVEPNKVNRGEPNKNGIGPTPHL